MRWLCQAVGRQQELVVLQLCWVTGRWVLDASSGGGNNESPLG